MPSLFIIPCRKISLLSWVILIALPDPLSVGICKGSSSFWSRGQGGRYEEEEEEEEEGRGGGGGCRFLGRGCDHSVGLFNRFED